MEHRRQQLDGGDVLWYIGDSVLKPQMQELAASLQATLLEASTEACDFQSAISQNMNIWMRRRRTPVTVILYLAISDYDAEGMIWKILRVIKEGSRIILIVKPKDDRTIEAADHFSPNLVKLVAVDDFEGLVQKCLTTLLSNEN